MPVSVTLPALGESVTEGTVTRWLKQEGEPVQADEPLLEVSTDKVDTEIPAPASGVLLAIKVREDETVAVGTELAVIGESAETAAPGRPGEQQPAGTGPAGEAAAGAPGTGATGAGAPGAGAPAWPTWGTQPTPPQPSPAHAAPAPAQPSPAHAAPTAAEPEPAHAGGPTVSVTLPALGESVTEGTVTRWLKQEGEPVQADEPLLEVSTDKVDTEIPAPASGVLLAIRVREDETVAVGTELAVIGPDGAEAGARQEEAPTQAAMPAPAQAAPPAPAVREAAPAPAPATQPATPPAPPAPPAAAPEEPSADGPAYVTPLVRKLASEHGIDLAQVRGTGVGGRVRKQDVLEAARARQEAQRAAAQQVQAGPGPAPAETAPLPSGPRPAPAGVSPLRGRTEKMSRLRRVIAARMVESLQISAQLTTVVEVDVTNVARLRDRAKEGFLAREGVRLTFLPFFAKAAVEALKSHPSVNASIDTERGEITYHDAEHLGVAVDTERGLLVPVVRDAGDLNLAGLARKINDLAERTRSSQITPDELSGGTFTVTNTGSRGALFDTPIINQPQVAILGTGAVVKRPVVVAHPELGETIAIRSVAYLALTYDHRLVDGADAARFLTTVKNRLEEGDFAAELGL